MLSLDCRMLVYKIDIKCARSFCFNNIFITFTQNKVSLGTFLSHLVFSIKVIHILLSTIYYLI